MQVKCWFPTPILSLLNSVLSCCHDYLSGSPHHTSVKPRLLALIKSTWGAPGLLPGLTLCFSTYCVPASEPGHWLFSAWNALLSDFCQAASFLSFTSQVKPPQRGTFPEHLILKKKKKSQKHHPKFLASHHLCFILFFPSCVFLHLLSIFPCLHINFLSVGPCLSF